MASGQLTWRGRSKMGVPTLRRFLARVRAAYPGPPIHLIWDNRPGHAHPEVLARAADLEIEVPWLPPYAPWPTPIEKLWRWLTQDLLRHHRLADQFRALQARVAARLDQFARPSPALPRHVGLTCWPG